MTGVVAAAVLSICYAYGIRLGWVFMDRLIQRRRSKPIRGTVIRRG